MSQALFERVWEDVQPRIHAHGVRIMKISRTVDDLQKMWLGPCRAYDVGLAAEDDTLLASALWRNVYGGGEVSAHNLQMLVAYVHREIASLSELSSKELMAGKVSWGALPVSLK